MKLTARVLPGTFQARPAAAVLILASALLVGSGNRGYSLRPWRTEIAARPGALAELTNERIVLVQSGLYPHGGYDARIQLLTPTTLRDSEYAGAAVWSRCDCRLRGHTDAGLSHETPENNSAGCQPHPPCGARTHVLEPVPVPGQPDHCRDDRQNGDDGRGMSEKMKWY
jgi:hypothetical protein